MVQRDHRGRLVGVIRRPLGSDSIEKMESDPNQKMESDPNRGGLAAGGNGKGRMMLVIRPFENHFGERFSAAEPLA